MKWSNFLLCGVALNTCYWNGRVSVNVQSSFLKESVDQAKIRSTGCFWHQWFEFLSLFWHCWKWDGMKWYAIPAILHFALNLTATSCLINTIPVCWMANVGHNARKYRHRLIINRVRDEYAHTVVRVRFSAANAPESIWRPVSAQTR